MWPRTTVGIAPYCPFRLPYSWSRESFRSAKQLCCKAWNVSPKKVWREIIAKKQLCAEKLYDRVESQSESDTPNEELKCTQSTEELMCNNCMLSYQITIVDYNRCQDSCSVVDWWSRTSRYGKMIFGTSTCSKLAAPVVDTLCRCAAPVVEMLI